MRRTLPLVVALAACAGDDVELPTGPAVTTALRYDWAIDLATRAAATTVTLRVDEPGDCVGIDSSAGDLADLAIDGVPVDRSGVQGGVLTACGRG